ncbi:MAG TPA: DUF1206 domain-containing protein [Mycobacteriales bacterium]|nr:DUF1206 domain-containing protein [Mycobacteriales bacterium]
MATATQTAKSTAREARSSEPVTWLARFGFAGRGVVYLVLGALALQLAVGHSARADKTGALGAIKDKPLGGVLLVVLAISFAGYAVWRLLDGLVGHREDDNPKRAAKRVASLARGVIYGFLAFSTARFVVSPAGGDKTEPLTARVMSMTGGRTVVGLVGAALVMGGLVIAYRGVTEKFMKRLDLASSGGGVRRAVQVIGVTGLAGRGLVVALVGGFLVQAAVTFDPDKAKGLDASLKALAGAPLGTALLACAAVGLLAFGAWSFVESRYRKV